MGFLLSGLFVSLCLAVGNASFRYLACALLWTLSSAFWFARPGPAAWFSIAPVAAIAVYLWEVRKEIPNQSPMHEYWIVLASVFTALLVIATAVAVDRQVRPLPSMAGLAIVALSIFVDRRFTDRVEIQTYEMHWSANGEVPWGRTERVPYPLTVWRKVGGSECTDDFNSEALRNRVLSTDRPTVTVQYNLFRSFGRVSGYNVRSVDGYLLNEGKQSIHPGWLGGGQIEEVRTDHPVDCP